MSLFLLSKSASRAPHAELYVEIDSTAARTGGRQVVDVIVGNRGDLVSHDAFDAVIETDRKGKTVCRATTNFVTPIGPGESIRALRLEVVSGSGTPETYAISASLQPWEPTHAELRKRAAIAFSPGEATCIALKPLQ